MEHTEQDQVITIEWSDRKPKELFTAILQTQAELPVIKEASKNPHFKNNYAQYSDIVSAIRLVLNKNNLIFFHQPDHEHEVLYTYIAHAESGQWMRGSLEMKPSQDTEQARGSSISYIKRYTLVAMLGIATGDDDDGHVASQRTSKGGYNGNGKSTQNGSDRITPAQVQELKDMCSHRPEFLDYILKQCRIMKLDDMPQSYFAKAKEWIAKQLSS